MEDLLPVVTHKNVIKVKGGRVVSVHDVGNSCLSDTVVEVNTLDVKYRKGPEVEIGEDQLWSNDMHKLRVWNHEIHEISPLRGECARGRESLFSFQWRGC